jgi:hypothetical protein
VLELLLRKLFIVEGIAETKGAFPALLDDHLHGDLERGVDDQIDVLSLPQPNREFVSQRQEDDFLVVDSDGDQLVFLVAIFDLDLEEFVARESHNHGGVRRLLVEIHLLWNQLHPGGFIVLISHAENLDVELVERVSSFGRNMQIDAVQSWVFVKELGGSVGHQEEGSDQPVLKVAFGLARRVDYCVHGLHLGVLRLYFHMKILEAGVSEHAVKNASPKRCDGLVRLIFGRNAECDSRTTLFVGLLDVDLLKIIHADSDISLHDMDIDEQFLVLNSCDDILVG